MIQCQRELVKNVIFHIENKHTGEQEHQIPQQMQPHFPFQRDLSSCVGKNLADLLGFDF